MTGVAPRFGEADLSSCDREPIHIPGSIQPHGLLLVVDRQDLAIRQFAGDTHFLLGIEPRRLPQLTLVSLFEDQLLRPIAERLRGAEATIAPFIQLGLTSRSGALPLDATIHARGDIAIIELEAARRHPAQGGDPLSQVKSMLAALQATDGFEACCRAAAVQLRAAIGFDRVMVYQFQHDDSGKVIAEDKADGIDGFLDLHYPASDIPKQARALYRRNWLRLIPNAAYVPAPLEPAAVALDMSDCSLRSVSPLHLEYLKNMGVTASLSISIVVGDRLWGLFACHHDTPRTVAADLRVACEVFAQIFSLHLEAKIEAEAAHRRLAARKIHEALAARMIAASDIGAELVAEEGALLGLVPAGGVALWLDGQLRTIGHVPPAEFISPLVDWLQDQHQPIIDTNCLSAVFPAAEPFAALASGVLAVSLSRQPADYVIWFRPEVVRTVTWAGNPEKPVTIGPHGDRLTPRQSFEAWQDEVRRQSAPWDGVDIEAAHAFRVWLLETVLRQMDLAQRERDAAFAHQSLLMAELDHRVKNTLANIQALVRQTKAGADSLEDFALSLEQRIQAMAHAHSLLAATRWQGASLRGLLEEELAPYHKDRDGHLHLSGDAVILSPKAALPVSMVLHELTCNAAKYGALSTPAGRVDVTWRREGGFLVVTWTERDGPPVTPPSRRGFGSVVIERGLRHEIKGTAKLTFDAKGVGCVITIPIDYVVLDKEGER